METKKGLEASYEKYVKNNSEDEYSKACVNAGEAVAKLLDEGATAEAALEGLMGHGLTGFMASMAAKGVAHFHPRGEEIRVAWNAKNGIKTENGIVNAAVMTFNDNGTVTPEIEAV